MKKYILTIIVLFFLTKIQAQINFPDNNFKVYLLSLSPFIDTNSDGEIQVSEANAYTGDIIPSRSLYPIVDITGIEYFTNITTLSCENIPLGSVDLSKNIELTYLNLANCQLNNIDLSKNSKLQTLIINNNNLTNLDLINNTNLTSLNCAANKLPHLDISFLRKLIQIGCGANEFSSIDFSTNGLLDLVDISKSPKIRTLDFSTNFELRDLRCDDSDLRTLDLSANNKLEVLTCTGNPRLKSLNIANGNNVNMYQLWAHYNPALNCVAVDDVALAQSKTSATGPWLIDFKQGTQDPRPVYSTYATCAAPGKTFVPDDDFEAALKSGGYDSGAPDNEVSTSNISSITTLDISDKYIYDLTGLEDFVSLQTLTCNRNYMKSIDLTNMANLQTLTLQDNTSLTTLILPGGANVSPKANNNSNKSNVVNTTLITLDLQGNSLTSLNLQNYSRLTTIKVNGNNLSSLNVQNGNNQNIPSANFDARYNNSNLTEIIVDDIAYATANWTNVDAGVTFSTSATLGVEDAILNSKIAVYPNPTHAYITVKTPTEYTVDNMTIYSVTGHQVRYFRNTTKSLDLSNLSNGIYFLRIKTSKGTLTKKIVKY